MGLPLYPCLGGHYHGTLLWERVTCTFNGLGPECSFQAGPSLPCGGCGEFFPSAGSQEGWAGCSNLENRRCEPDRFVGGLSDEVLNEAGGESALSARFWVRLRMRTCVIGTAAWSASTLGSPRRNKL